MRDAKWQLVLLLALLSGTHQAAAQTGSWNPPGADLTYPRTLLKAADLSSIQASLAAADRLALYQTLWDDVQGSPTSDNVNTNGRRARAAFAKNAAFVVLLGRQPAGASLVALPAAQRGALTTSIRILLENINTDVEVFATPAGDTPYSEWQWRSKELIDYLIAYDLLRGSGETAASLLVAQARLQEFAGNLYRQSTTPLGPYFFYNIVKNNHTLMTAAALGMAAVVLNDAGSADPTRQPASWAGAGLYHIDNVLWRDALRQSDSTQVAGYAEGPYYFKYAMLNCLPFFRAMGNFLPDGRQTYAFGNSTRRIRNPYFDPKYARLYSWVMAILQPDGRLPALEDSFVDMGMPELALTGNPQFVKPMYFSKVSGTVLASNLAQLRDVTVDMRAAWLAASVLPTAQNQPTLTALPASGNLVFRSGNDSLATYLHLNGRGGLAQANSGGHSQGDASSFLLHAQGQLLALDPGYLSYNRRTEVGQATHHNLVLVDGAGPAIGTPSVSSPVSASIQHTLQTPQLTYGEVTTVYEGADITRKAVFVRNSYFLLADAVTAAAPHAYTWQLHGYGLQGGTPATGIFSGSLANQESTWEKNGVGLLAHVATDGTATYSTATNVHETTYNTAENHTTLLVQQAGAAQAQFLTALCPYTTQRPQVTTISQPGTAALAASTAGFVDLALAQADTVLQTTVSPLLAQPVSADGQLNLYSTTTGGDFAQLFVQQGTQLSFGTAAVLRASRRATISWQQSSATRYDGYASRATTLTLALNRAPSAVSGTGVANYSYNASRQELQVVLQSATAFVVLISTSSFTPNPLPVTLTDFAASRHGAAVRLSWHTASEQHNAGFEVQRQTDAVGYFTAIGFVAGAGTATKPTSYTFPDDSAPATAAYYRLRQIDQNGTSTYSPVAAIAAAPTTAPRILAVSPQPAHDQLQVQLTSMPDQPVTLEVLDALGRVVRRQQSRQSTTVDVGNLPGGLYYLRAADGAGQPLGGSQKILIAP
ncbi:heparinase II/III domain-containing protein [Hymenobacter rubidus]|uniref:heparinase II/III domain-containing protein n=1 Tax=Hymenobacter rubidus TaxID=1441626 RepID=UPI00191D31E7|nr:heparinase II/III family protein [Hymenobacter rubidus]